ncbi:CU044_5270 family protein [Actinoplanes sp. GCM10030250]|uniref:CU044_5270 family protein n=1 Tax=Actinoplanes sp. GCM10030250 TaxID=3273376 RepID=UPI00361A1802
MSDLTTAPPTGPDLPDSRRRALRAHLMDEIHASPQPARRRRLMMMAAPAGVLAAVVAAGVIAGPWNDSVRPNPTTQVLAGDHDAALVFLDRLAAMAMARPASGATEGRYLYVKSRIAYMEFTDNDKGSLDELHDREIWLPLFAGGKGRLKEVDRPTDLGVFTAERVQPDLPQDPDELLRKIYADSAGKGNSPDGQAFTVIGDLLGESMFPAPTNAAIYQAAAKIPGVELVRDAVDATGRHGVAVAREELGERREWIFDEASGDYLGERSYLVEDKPYGKAGMITATTAVTERGVVDRLGRKP